MRANYRVDGSSQVRVLGREGEKGSFFSHFIQETGAIC